jgi:hypothetical protein
MTTMFDPVVIVPCVNVNVPVLTPVSPIDIPELSVKPPVLFTVIFRNVVLALPPIV